MKKARYAVQVEKDPDADHFQMNESYTPGWNVMPSRTSQSMRYSRITCMVRPPLRSRTQRRLSRPQRWCAGSVLSLEQ
uniref:Uncharacterized protein n=1 Tax=Arundo donax TaxID=35708 RepID=A0A0A9CDQ5_ARUDO